jgi:small subunit ribosomal protein S2
MFYQNYFTIQKLLENGVHYGHRKNRWNPKMAQYIYGIKNKVHIIDLEQTAKLLETALQTMRNLAAKNGRILFVSTKKQASDIVAEQALRCGQYYVNKRWLGGMLSNWPTVSASIKKMDAYATTINETNSLLKKKEILILTRKHDKLEGVLGGIRSMGGLPDMVFIIDAAKHHIAVKEANKLGIPVCAVVDTNSDPTGIEYVIPGNDDARKAIELYANLAAEAVLLGIQESLTSSGVDAEPLTDVSKLGNFYKPKENTDERKRSPRNDAIRRLKSK